MIFGSSEEALYDFKNGSSIMIGGFGLCGVPENLLEPFIRRILKTFTSSPIHLAQMISAQVC